MQVVEVSDSTVVAVQAVAVEADQDRAPGLTLDLGLALNRKDEAHLA